jgi:predicted ferric reductase
MYRWHHRAGVAAYVLLLFHPLFLAADALPNAPLSAWQVLSPFSQGLPVWLGWLSMLLLMAGLATTFQARIPYRLWRWLHVGLGLAVLLGLVHLVLLGIEEPVLPILGLALMLLGWRVVRGDLGLAARPYVVQSAEQVAQDMVEISLTPLAGAVALRPGQFVLVAFFAGPTFRGCGEFHPFTVSWVGASHQFRIGVKALGDCTRHLQSIEAGVKARVHGGFGDFLADRPTGPQLWIAGGIGITPFLGVLREEAIQHPVTLFYFYRAESDAAFLQELRNLADGHGQLSLRALVTGNAAPDLASLLPDAQGLAGQECYLCGPPPMIATLKKLFHERGLAPRHVHFEDFGFR